VAGGEEEGRGKRVSEGADGDGESDGGGGGERALLGI